MSFFKNLFGLQSADYRQLQKEGAVILDVRTRTEFAAGHIPGSINIPVDELKKNISKLTDREKPVITCCASGLRSAAAKKILHSNGFARVYNGGNWNSLERKLKM